MVTVIRQHVEGYISCLMYSDNSQCFISYCKKTRDITVKVVGNENYGNLYYDNLSQNLVTEIMDMVVLMTDISLDNVPNKDIGIVIKFIKDIRRQVGRRVIKSLVKPYHKASSFNPKNRRVISAK